MQAQTLNNNLPQSQKVFVSYDARESIKNNQTRPREKSERELDRLLLLLLG